MFYKHHPPSYFHAEVFRSLHVKEEKADCHVILLFRPKEQPGEVAVKRVWWP